jgi:hypothetical protein
LDVIIFPLPPFADFEFNGEQRAIGALLIYGALALQTPPVVKDRQRPK